VLPFERERVAAAMAKTIFDMGFGFVIADVRPPLPSASAED
jgi:hypothetical protein